MIIRLIEIVCPQRHSVLTLPYAPEEWPSDQAMKYLCEQFDQMCSGILERRCGICGSDDLVFEDNVTKFQSWEEAMRALQENAHRQAIARKVFHQYREKNKN